MNPAASVVVPSAGGVQVESPRFGIFSVPEDSVLVFPEGLIGFPDYHRFVIMEHATASPLRWLLCLDEPNLAFAVADPADFFRDYRVTVPEDLSAASSEDMAVFVIVTVPRDSPAAMSANLVAPVVVNVRTRLCRQIIVDDGLFSTRHPLLPRPAEG